VGWSFHLTPPLFGGLMTIKLLEDTVINGTYYPKGFIIRENSPNYLSFLNSFKQQQEDNVKQIKWENIR
jgi:hypothetical protein